MTNTPSGPHIFVGSNQRLSLTDFGLFILDIHNDQPLWSHRWSQITTIRLQGDALLLTAIDDHFEVTSINSFDTPPYTILTTLKAWQAAHAQLQQAEDKPISVPSNNAEPKDADKRKRAEEDKKITPLYIINMTLLFPIMFYAFGEELNFFPNPSKVNTIFRAIMILAIFAIYVEIRLVGWLMRRGEDVFDGSEKTISPRAYLLAFLPLSAVILGAEIGVPKQILQDRNTKYGTPFEADATIIGKRYSNGRGGPRYSLTVVSDIWPQFTLYVESRDYQQDPLGTTLHISGTRSEYGMYVQKWSPTQSVATPRKN